MKIPRLALGIPTFGIHTCYYDTLLRLFCMLLNSSIIKSLCNTSDADAFPKALPDQVSIFIIFIGVREPIQRYRRDETYYLRRLFSPITFRAVFCLFLFCKPVQSRQVKYLSNNNLYRYHYYITVQLSSNFCQSALTTASYSGSLPDIDGYIQPRFHIPTFSGFKLLFHICFDRNAI